MCLPAFLLLPQYVDVGEIPPRYAEHVLTPTAHAAPPAHPPMHTCCFVFPPAPVTAQVDDITAAIAKHPKDYGFLDGAFGHMDDAAAAGTEGQAST